MRIPLRFVALLIVAAALVGVVLAMTVWDTEEGPADPGQGRATGAVTGETGSTGSTDFAQVYPRPVKGPLLGVNLTAYTADGYAQQKVRDDMVTLAGLGTTAVTLVPTWYMRTADANRIAPDPDKSPSDESLIKAIEWARENDLKVIIKPHVDVLDETYRGEIQPANRSAWFDSYGKFIDHYASLASSRHAEMFVVGTELKTMSSDTESWRRVIQLVRARFTMPLTYAANWDEADQIRFWDDLDAIGIDAYYPLSENVGEAPTVGELVGSWKGIADRLSELSRRWDRPVILTEVGYPSQIGATVTPYSVTDQPADQKIQALAYQATFEALKDAGWLKGISWWSWRADPSAEERLDVDYSPEGKQAQGELARGQFLYQG